ncbi:MAG TPA: PilN domain-containing protein [Candidatus Baltobacteraceae bacterium]|jgi:Tfp pilus assembly protein PilN|nr:PilN domain-containing protein [Candidatus Baltobacteraceae bacterium]
MGFAVTNFNFLRASVPLWVVRLQGVRIPEHLTGALLAVGVSLTIVAGAMLIERYRLQGAQADEAAYRRRFERSTTNLATERVFYDRVRRLLALQRKLTEISESGDAQAIRLARIARAVPTHAWLTSLRERDDAIVLEGGTASLARLADVLRALTAVHDIGASTLTGVRTTAAYGAPAFQYGIILNSAKR